MSRFDESDDLDIESDLSIARCEICDTTSDLTFDEDGRELCNHCLFIEQIGKDYSSEE